MVAAVGGDASRVTFVICAGDTMEPIGTTSVTHIDQRHRTCEIDLAIMEPDRRGQAIGTEVVGLVISYAIKELDMHNVQLRVYEYNWAGRRSYEMAGFREYGRRREAVLHDGRRWDVMFMEVLASEWPRATTDHALPPPINGTCQ